MVVHPSFFEAFRFWLKLGFISFGGPAGQIAIMHQEIVEKKNLGILSFTAMQWLKIGMIPVIAVSGVVGVAWNLF